MKVRLTVLTTTYNRSYTLDRLYDSLINQVDKGFEWVVVDDGSTDDTRAKISSWAAGSAFPIRYVRKENGGKHTAINLGVNSSFGEWIFIVDSDDGLTSDAVEVVNKNISEFLLPSTGGLCYRKSYFNDELIGRITLDHGPIKLHPTEAGHYFCGDLAYVFKRKLLAKNSFPIIKNEKFVPELFIWNKIGDESEVIFFPSTVIYRCEYMADGYSKNFFKNLKKNPFGFGLYYGDQFFREKNWLFKIKCAIRWIQCFFLRSKIISALF